VVDLAVVLDPATTVEVVGIRDREPLEFAPPHPASVTATATPPAASPRTRDLRGGYVAAVGRHIEPR
jgi:hypothetical protein